jgi:NodT family efflux transporter outer membrane factor (OMF) lipoprotein
MRTASLAAICAAVGLAACSLAPNYARPSSAPAAAAYAEAGDWIEAAPADAVPRGAWWTVFHDDALNALESQVTAANQGLKAALARLDAARAQTRIARAGYFPTISASGAVTRSQTSINSPDYNPAKPATGNDYLAGLDFSYELDLFGRVRSAVAGARASEQATAGDVATLDLGIHAELASDYFTLRGLDAQQELLDRTVADYSKALELTDNLYRGGAAAIADVQQAAAQLELARTQAEDTRLRRSQLEHAMAVLVGKQPAGFHVDPSPLPLGLAPPAVDPGLPSALVERRPDVAAAERRVAAANAAIGVARAAYFPAFSLGGALGRESTATSSWFTAPSRFWSVGPQGLLTLIDGGLHRAQSAAARAAYDEQVANYRSTVLGAFQEVEDELAALRQLERESASQAAAVAATQGALDQANFRYKGGIVTYLEVVATENAALTARLAAVDIQTRRIGATILLIRAIGGGWRATDPAGGRAGH